MRTKEHLNWSAIMKEVYGIMGNMEYHHCSGSVNITYQAKACTKELFARGHVENKAKHPRDRVVVSGTDKCSLGYFVLLTSAIFRRVSSAFSTLSWVIYQRIDSGMNLEGEMLEFDLDIPRDKGSSKQTVSP